MADNGQNDLADQLKESRWLKIARAYRRIPLLGRLPVDVLALLLGAVLAVLMAVFFPQKDCSCGDRFADPKLEAMARQGNQAVRRYLEQKDNTINCAGRRKELLQELEKERKRGHRKQ